MTSEKVYEDPMKKYQDYLVRYTRTNGMTLHEAHQLLLNRIVAKEYGISEEQLIWLDENL